MTPLPPAPERPSRDGPERPRRDGPDTPPGSELTAALWLLAVLIAVVELIWLAAERIYSD